jgi:hypothetical protein
MFDMNIAYLIFAYKNPELIKKTIKSLSSENSCFYIHIDKKANMDKFSCIQGGNIFFIEKRIPVYWGEYSGVQAILTLIQTAMNAEKKHDYFVLLSGSEYLLQNNEYIQNYFEKNRGVEFINIVKMPNIDAGKPISRINTLRIQSYRPIIRFFVKALARLGLAQRDHKKYLGSLVPYSGNTWWALTRNACQYILEFERNNRPFCKYFENTFAPEEMFFHTILGNSEFQGRTNKNVMYEDWSERGSHPAIISENHIKLFEDNEKVILHDVYGTGEMLFARKLSDDNLDFVERMDNIMKKKALHGNEWVNLPCSSP